MEMFEDFNTYVDSFGDAILEKEKQRLEELSKNPPKDVDFTYSQEELDRIISSYMNELEKRKTSNLSDNGRTIEDYEEVWNNNQAVPSDIVKLVDSYNKLADKNDINNVEYIVRQINDKYSKDLMKLPVEIDKTIDEIKEHLQWLYQKRDLDRYLKGKQEKTTAEEEQKRVEQTRMQEQQERSAYIQSKLDTINSKINVIKTNEELFEPLRVDMLKERTYFYNKKDNIEASDIDRLNNYLAKLDSLEQKVINKKAEVEVPKNNQDEEEINRLKEELSKLNNQIAEMITYMKPYMRVSKVNEEMTKVINKNNELDSLQIVDSIADYKRMIETKKELVVFLEKATDFIKTRVEQAKVTEKPVIEEPKPLPNDFWNEFDKPIEKEKTGPLPPDFWKEFDSPEPLTRPERMFNQDGTYTYEYMTYLATTPIGFNKDIYDQLEKYNETVKRQKTEGIEITPIEEKQSSGGMHM